MYEITTNRNKFDFEIGYFIESPCRNCSRREEAPQCFDTCPTLDRIRRRLAEGISCYNHASAV
ncbi:MAG: hypothetical protein SWH68_05245 [Thermodesulfobacteriota bacterium]|nr:hypothetical protein [Thermodesulfobacteriota bacterium]